jgi:hypothetical protein
MGDETTAAVLAAATAKTAADLAADTAAKASTLTLQTAMSASALAITAAARASDVDHRLDEHTSRRGRPRARRASCQRHNPGRGARIGP